MVVEVLVGGVSPNPFYENPNFFGASIWLRIATSRPIPMYGTQLATPEATDSLPKVMQPVDAAACASNHADERTAPAG